MDRIEFINRTHVDDDLRKLVLETFWDQYMLVCELSDNVEEVSPVQIVIDNGKIAFQLIYSDAKSAEKMQQTINSNSYFGIYERQFRVTCVPHTRPNIITVMIE